MAATSSGAKTIIDLLRAGADAAPAIHAPGRASLTFADLRRQTAEMAAALAGGGIGANDRVAIVLANGPEMAAVFLAVCAGAAAAPLNPAYREDEFEFYLRDLGARALILAAGDDTPARVVAGRLGIPIIEMVTVADAPAGRFRLDIGAMSAAAASPVAAAGDIALVLHTSGTTSRPKIVPLTQGNLCASARNIAATLALSPDDCCLNVMPLFHIHGLVAAVLAALGAGGSVYCAPGFNALRFFAWLDEAPATWYSAVPTMHQAILSRAERNAEIIARNPLRFLRSSSASLPPPVMARLEETFGAPVLEAYGMTEAAHQMASNPLPPRERKPGSVGVAAGPEIAIMDESGALLDTGKTGEVVIRGDNVTPGYENNEEANAGAFANGWFRTGDQGVIDAEGYLRITGRLKEIINRGGEKISPREVDEVLLRHPAVEQAVAFAVPHEKLGEDIAAAVVVRDGAEASDRELKDFAAERLAAFKVPARILIVADIPKGATGKLQRIGLAAKLGLAP